METGSTGHVEYIKYGKWPNRLKVVEMTCNLLLVEMCRINKLLNFVQAAASVLQSHNFLEFSTRLKTNHLARRQSSALQALSSLLFSAVSVLSLVVSRLSFLLLRAQGSSTCPAKGTAVKLEIRARAWNTPFQAANVVQVSCLEREIEYPDKTRGDQLACEVIARCSQSY